MLARLILARHGETDWNRQHLVQGHTDVPLNDTGREQAQALAARLAEEQIDALYSSDLQRAAETATIVGGRIDRAPQLSECWRELRLGTLEGKPTREFAVLIAQSSRAADDPLAEGAESFADLRRRVVWGFQELADAWPGKTVAVIGHGGSLKTLIAHLLDLDPRRIDRLSLRGNTSISVFDFRHGRPQLTLLNCTRHLGDGR